MKTRNLVLTGTVISSFIFFSPLISFAQTPTQTWDNFSGKYPSFAITSVGTVNGSATATIRTATSAVTIYGVDFMPKQLATPAGTNRIYLWCGLSIFELSTALQGNSYQTDIPNTCTNSIGSLTVQNSTTIPYVYKIIWIDGNPATTTQKAEIMSSSTDLIIANVFNLAYVSGAFFLVLFIIYLIYKIFR